MLEATAVRQVSNAEGDIYLFDLYKNKNEFNYEPVLIFEKVEYDGCWDNSEYVFKFLRRLKNNKKSAEKELKDYCKENELDFQSTRQDLLDIFSTSKKLGFW